ncbi:MAG: MG2 domain-containing protein, partial [Candidatus Woesearchaeota archaeon]
NQSGSDLSPVYSYGGNITIVTGTAAANCISMQDLYDFMQANLSDVLTTVDGTAYTMYVNLIIGNASKGGCIVDSSASITFEDGYTYKFSTLGGYIDLLGTTSGGGSGGLPLNIFDDVGDQYNPGDTVYIFSTTIDSSGALVASTVTITIYKPDGTVLETGTSTATSTGRFRYSFELPSDAPLGTYRVDIDATYGSDEVHDNLAFKVEAASTGGGTSTGGLPITIFNSVGTIYDTGDMVRIYSTTVNSSGALINATVNVSVYNPDRSLLNAGSSTILSTGRYEYNFTAPGTEGTYRVEINANFSGDEIHDTEAFMVAIGGSSGTNASFVPQVQVEAPAVIDVNTDFSINTLTTDKNGIAVDCTGNANLSIRDTLNGTNVIPNATMDKFGTGLYNYSYSAGTQSTYLIIVKCIVQAVEYVGIKEFSTQDVAGTSGTSGSVGGLPLNIFSDTGAFYSPGDKAIVFVLTTNASGALVSADVNVSVLYPNQTNLAKGPATEQSLGTFNYSFTLPSTAPAGTYQVKIDANYSGNEIHDILAFVISATLEGISTTVNNINTTVNTINENVITINATVNNIRSTVNTINSTVNYINSTVNNIASNITNILSIINIINSTVNTIDSTVTNINSTVTNINANITYINAIITNINTTVTSISSTITYINSTIDNINSLVQSINSTIILINSTVNNIGGAFEITSLVTGSPRYILNDMVIVEATFASGNGSYITPDTINLTIWDPTYLPPAWDSAVKGDFTENDNHIWWYKKTITSPIATGMYYVHMAATYNNITSSRSTQFRIASGGPYSVNLECPASITVGSSLDCYLKILDEGEAATESTCDVWVDTDGDEIRDSTEPQDRDSKLTVPLQNETILMSLDIPSLHPTGAFVVLASCSYANSIQPNSTASDSITLNSAAAPPPTEEPTPAPSAGGGGGGGGAGAGKIPKVVVTGFEVSPTLIKEKLIGDQTVKKTITITNVDTKKLNLNIDFSGVTDFVITPDGIEELEIELGPGEKYSVNIILFGFDMKKSGVYGGNIIVSANGAESKINIILEYELEKPIFGVAVDLLKDYEEVFAGEDVFAGITLFNLRDVGKVDVNVDYSIKNSEGQTIVSESTIVAVQTQTSIIKSLTVPQNTKPGNYIFSAEATFNGVVGIGSDTFKVVEEPSIIKVPSCLPIALLILLVLAVIILIYREKIKTKKIYKQISNLGIKNGLIVIFGLAIIALLLLNSSIKEKILEAYSAVMSPSICFKENYVIWFLLLVMLIILVYILREIKKYARKKDSIEGAKPLDKVKDEKNKATSKKVFDLLHDIGLIKTEEEKRELEKQREKERQKAKQQKEPETKGKEEERRQELEKSSNIRAFSEKKLKKQLRLLEDSFGSGLISDRAYNEDKAKIEKLLKEAKK